MASQHSWVTGCIRYTILPGRKSGTGRWRRKRPSDACHYFSCAKEARTEKVSGLLRRTKESVDYMGVFILFPPKDWSRDLVNEGESLEEEGNQPCPE